MKATAKKKLNTALVAIVGEPNVGKSTILNKVISQRAALTSSVAGTTRDRFYAAASWNGVDFMLVDTAGIVLEQQDELERNVQKQVRIAVEEADLLLYVIDGKLPPEHINRSILQLVRKQKKPVLLAVNKTDSPKKFQEAQAAYAFTGIKQVFPVSALSGMGTGDLLDGIAAELKRQGFGAAETRPGELAVSIVGKPNVGKSSLFNSILGEERVVVSNVPGTTRNVVDTVVEYKGRSITFLDTAGLKRKEKRAPLPDIYAALQTIRALHRSDICLLVIDASEGISQQDQKIAGEIVDANKGLIVAVNKVDLLDKRKRSSLEDDLPHFFPFLWWAPAVPVSAKSGEGIEDLLNYILQIRDSREKTIANQELSEFFYAKLKQRQPQRIRDERAPKVYSLRQTGTNPPTFEMLVNEPSAISTQFRKFIQNAIVKELGFWGTPVRLKLAAKRGLPGSGANKEE